MANLTENSTFDTNVRRLDAGEKITGFTNSSNTGLINQPIQNLTNRTRWLKQAVDAVSVGQLGDASIHFGNWDTLTTSGFYYKNSSEISEPAADQDWLVLVVNKGGDTVQIAIGTSAESGMYWRNREDLAWGSWHTFASMSYVDTEVNDKSVIYSIALG